MVTMITIYVKKEKEPNFDLQHLMTENDIEYKELQLNTEHFSAKDTLRRAIKLMREKGKTGTFNELAVLPIVQTELFALNAKDLSKIDDVTLIELLKQGEGIEKKKLKIKKITKQKIPTIGLSGEDEARINTTVIKVIYGKDINIEDIVDSWPNGEKAAFMIAWRLASHAQAETLLVMADMLKNRAEQVDKYRKKEK
jgi:hypothetical protein